MLHGLDADAARGGRRQQPAALLAHDRLLRAVVEQQQHRPRARAGASANGSSKTSRCARRLEHREQVLGVAGQRGPAAGPPDRLGDPAGRPGGQHGAAPHERVGVGQRDGEHLGRVDREVAVRRAGDRDVVERLGHRLGVGRRPELDPVEVGQHHDRRGELVAGDGRQDRAPAAGGVLGDHRRRRAGHHHLAAAADRLGDRRRGAGVGPVGRQHDDEVEAAGPARQGRPRPGDERHRAPRLEDRAQQPGVGAGGDDGARPVLLAGPGHRLLDRGRGLAGLAPHPRAGLGQRAQPERRGPRAPTRRRAGTRRTRSPLGVGLSRAGGLRRRAAPGCRRGRGRPGRRPGTPARRPSRVRLDRAQVAVAVGQTMIASSSSDRLRGIRRSPSGSGRAHRRAPAP